MRNQPCPDAQRLSDFVAGKLSEPEIDDVSRHLDTCESCQSAVDLLEERPVSDSLTCELTQPSDEARFEAEPELHAALERAMRAGAPPISPPALADALPAMIDEYQILERLGQGGMGTVYKAVHVRLHKTVAIKVLRADRMGDGDAAKRFQREMKALGTLDHENIVTAFDAGEADGVLYLVMKYVDGLDVAALVKAVGRLPVADACELVRQAAMALDYANRRGLVHRDLKPSNLVLDLDGRVSLLDLGLALFQGDRHAGAAAGTEPLQGVEETGDGLTTARQVIGTTDYMAPEQFEGSHEVDIRADIYSLGCTLYELLAGTAPFSGPEYATPLDKREGHLLRMAPPLAERRTDVPTGLLNVVHRTLRKRRDERYSNPKELADALAPFAADGRLRELCGRARCGAETKELGLTRETSAWSKPFAGFANVKAPPSAFGRAAGNPFRSDRGAHRYRGRLVGVVAGLLILAGGYYALRPEPEHVAVERSAWRDQPDPSGRTEPDDQQSKPRRAKQEHRAKLAPMNPIAASDSHEPVSQESNEAPNSEAVATHDGFAWSKLISPSTIEDLINAQVEPLVASTRTPALFKAGGNHSARVKFSLLAMLFGVIEQFDCDVRWKNDASGLRAIFGRAGVNCQAATDSAREEAAKRSEELAEFVNGAKIDIPTGALKFEWSELVNRPPLMSRMGKAGYNWEAKNWTSDKTKFKKNKDDLLKEAQLLAVIAHVIQDGSYEFAVDKGYLGLAKELERQAIDLAEAVKESDFERAQSATIRMNKACSVCHEGYRAGGGLRLSVEERLKRKMSLAFPMNTLVSALKQLGGDIGVKIEVMDDALRDVGILKDQWFALDERDRPAEEILRKILKLANPAGKLIYVIRPKAKTGDKVLYITTRGTVALDAARTALGEPNLETARQQIELATLDAGAKNAEVQQLGLFTRYVELFWKAVSDALTNHLVAGEEFTVNGASGAVVEGCADMLVIRFLARNREYPLYEIPTTLAIMLAERSLDKADKQTPVVIGAFLLADPKGDKEEALRLFQQAAANGVDVAPLVRELQSRAW